MIELREILFRGMPLNGDDFVVGNYNLVDGCHWIIPFEDGDSEFTDDWVQVKPESIGQFTGLFDKNRERIWGNSRCKHPDLGVGDVVFRLGKFMINYPEVDNYCLDLYEDLRELEVIADE